MAQLFRRVCSVTVDTLKVDGLRICFSIKKTLTKEPNTLDLKIYNLSKSTRSAMKKAGAKITVTAGYQNEFGMIFAGDARTVDHTHDQAEWVTHIQCGDGELAYRFARCSGSFASGTSIKDVIRHAVKSLGVNSGNLEDALQSAKFRANLSQFIHGYTAHGKASGELDKLLRSAGLTWSIQNGALQVLQGTAPAKGAAILLSPSTGLIGSPDHGTPEKIGLPPVLKVKSLLRPAARCGGVIEIHSEDVNGQFRVNQLEHTGDSANGDWFTNFEATSISSANQQPEPSGFVGSGAGT